MKIFLPFKQSGVGGLVTICTFVPSFFRLQVFFFYQYREANMNQSPEVMEYEICGGCCQSLVLSGLHGWKQKLTSMVEDWVSQANARQRRGRAGRVKPGNCFCLYTRHRFESLMRPFQVILCLQKNNILFGYFVFHFIIDSYNY